MRAPWLTQYYKLLAQSISTLAKCPNHQWMLKIKTKQKTWSSRTYLQGCWFIFLKIYLFKKKRFIYFRERKGGSGDRGRDNLKQALHWAQSPTGAQSHNPEIMTWAEIKSWMLNQLSPPSPPGDVDWTATNSAVEHQDNSLSPLAILTCRTEESYFNRVQSFRITWCVQHNCLLHGEAPYQHYLVRYGGPSNPYF